MTLGVADPQTSLFDVVIIGDGPFPPKTKQVISEQSLGGRVNFLGFAESEDEVRDALAEACVGLTPYLPAPDSLTYYADPGNVKQYLAAGVPVCVANVPPIPPASIIQGCAVVVESSGEGVAEGIRTMLSDPETLSARRNACYESIEDFTWDRVFTRVLGDLSASFSPETMDV